MSDLKIAKIDEHVSLEIDTNSVDIKIRTGEDDFHFVYMSHEQMDGVVSAYQEHKHGVAQTGEMK